MARKKKPTINDEIEHVLRRMQDLPINDSEYITAVDHLKILYEARSRKPAGVVDIETVFLVVAYSAQLIGILHFERFNVITSKAFNWVKRLL